jgi:hypothetical protein
VENRKSHQDIVIEERTYRLTKMDARSACWLFSFLASKSGNGEGILSSLGKCAKEQFDEIQTLALRHVFYLDMKDNETFPITVLAPNGSLVDQTLADHAGHLFKATTESIMFNLTPFLAAAESKT